MRASVCCELELGGCTRKGIGACRGHRERGRDGVCVSASASARRQRADAPSCAWRSDGRPRTHSQQQKRTCINTAQQSQTKTSTARAPAEDRRSPLQQQPTPPTAMSADLSSRTIMAHSRTASSAGSSGAHTNDGRCGDGEAHMRQMNNSTSPASATRPPPEPPSV